MTDPDPLLVRPFLASGDDAGDPEPGTRWPASEYRTIRSHRATASAKAPAPVAVASPSSVEDAARAPRRKARAALASAGAVVVVGLAATGYAMFRADDTRDGVPIPSGALPPIAAPSSEAISPQASRQAKTPPRPPERRGATTEPTATATASRTATFPQPPPPSPAQPPPAQATSGSPPPAAMIAPPEAARVGAITADNGLCLDLNGGVPADDNHIQVFDCNRTPAQRWTLAPDGTLQVAGKCAQVSGDRTVHIIGCDSREEAQWRAGPDDSLVNVAADACLTGADTPSTAVTVTECAARDAQQWTIPD